VRAAVGVEKFEEGADPAPPIAPKASALAKAESQTHARDEHPREARAAATPKREADASAGSSGSNTSGGGEGGSGSSGGAEKNPWTSPAHSGAEGPSA
jgi:hypothetical protein